MIQHSLLDWQHDCPDLRQILIIGLLTVTLDYGTEVQSPQNEH